jgi:Ca2+-binding RTX toxin-like protein
LRATPTPSTRRPQEIALPGRNRSFPTTRFAKWLSSHRSHGTVRRPVRKPGLRVEPLDDRLVPSTLSFDAAGLLTYTAGAAVANQLTVSLDPITDTYTFRDVEFIDAPGFLGTHHANVSVPNTAVNSMRILLGDYPDALTVEATQDRIQVQAGDGDDAITLGDTSEGLDGIQGQISVAGEDGLDHLMVNDQGATAGKGYVLTANGLTRNGSLLVDSYGTVEWVRLNTTAFNDSIVVRSTAEASDWYVKAGPRDDTLTAANTSGGLDGFLSRLQFDGEDGSLDRLIVDDTGSGGGRSFVVSLGSVRRTDGPNRAEFFYDTETVLVKGGAFDDIFTVEATTAAVTLDTDDGSDRVQVGDDAFTGYIGGWDLIQGALTVNGQAGGDVLSLSDAPSSVGRTYTVTAASVSRPGAAPIEYASVESVELEGSTVHNDRFDVQSTAAGTAVTLRAGHGFNTVSVGSTGYPHANSTLDKIQGALTVEGGGSGTQLYLNDQGNGVGQTYTITATGVSRTGMAPITYKGLTGLSINAGRSNDAVTVEVGQNAAMKVEVDGGVGDDLVNASTFQNDATLRGGLGDDTLTAGLGNDRVEGGDGNDILAGGDGLDTVLGGAGSDTVSGGDGVDSIDGGVDTDTLVESTPGWVYLDSASLQRTFGPTVITEPLAGVEEARLTGGETDDTISAYGFNGRVTIVGGTGNDTLITPLISGPATLVGGDGDDTLVSWGGDDLLDGGNGNDSLTGWYGDDVLIGGAGTDVLVESVGTYSVLTDTQFTGAGTDALSGIESAALSGSYYDDRIDAGAFSGRVTVYGGDGSDTLIGAAGADQLVGGTGIDWIEGRGGDDLISGDDGSDWLFGGLGNDTLSGDAGNDRLYDGGTGNDTLSGGTGSDTLSGEAGDDYLDGGGDRTTDYLYGGEGVDNCVQNWMLVKFRHYSYETGEWEVYWELVEEDQIEDF